MLALTKMFTRLTNAPLRPKKIPENKKVRKVIKRIEATGQRLVLRDQEEGTWIKELKSPRDFLFFLSAILNF